MDEDTPAIDVEPFVATRGRDRWLVTWRITNLGADRLRLVSAIQPHSRFRTDETPLVGDVPAAATSEITLPVRFVEPPGTVVENPFLIVRVEARGAEWNVLARVRVTSGAGGAPTASPNVVVTVNRGTERKM
jgi:hypothetical protein